MAKFRQKDGKFKAEELAAVGLEAANRQGVGSFRICARRTGRLKGRTDLSARDKMDRGRIGVVNRDAAADRLVDE